VQTTLNTIVIACLTVDDLSAIRELCQRHDGNVVAVALDLGHARNLRELYDLALAAGAARCHALDVREEFARECVLPAIDAETAADGADEVQARAREFVAKKLAAIAALEGDADVVPSTIGVVGPSTTPAAALDRPARIELAFENGVPRSLNDVPMSLVELLDVLAAIGAAHGVAPGEAGLRTLQVAHRSLASPSRGHAAARVEIFDGRITTEQDSVIA
jgi:argininosuccinate synthase